ncbi:acyl carrier protein [Kappamyces sp. JEL0829]|nr:acyl carrier protein [Kappamyces sp. JEL0829]
MHKILFVDKLNIRRAPVCSAVLAHLVAQRKVADQFLIDSCGTCADHLGEPVDKLAAAEAKFNKIDLVHTARLIDDQDFANYTHFLVMTLEDLGEVQKRLPPGCSVKIELLGTYDPRKELEIIDPYFLNPQLGFEMNFRHVKRCCEGLLKSLGF